MEFNFGRIPKIPNEFNQKNFSIQCPAVSMLWLKTGAIQLNTDPCSSFRIQISVLTVCIFNMTVKKSKFCHGSILFLQI